MTLSNNTQNLLAKYSISNFSSLDVSEGRVKNVITGYYNPIRSMAKDQVKNYLSIAISNAGKAYSGMKEGDKTMPEIIQECVRFTYDQFNSIGVNEIMDAFKLAAANRFENVDIKAYGGVFTVSLLGDVLYAYSKYRNKIIAKYLELKDIEQKAANKEQEKIKRNNDARQKIKTDIEAAIISIQQGVLFWKEWQDVPVHYAEIAVAEGWIEVSPEFKKRIWNESKELAKRQLIETAQDLSNLVEARKAKQILMQNIESEIISEPAKRIYAKRLIFEYVKQHEL